MTYAKWPPGTPARWHMGVFESPDYSYAHIIPGFLHLAPQTRCCQVFSAVFLLLCPPLTHHFQVVTTYFPVSTCYITTYSCPVPALSLCYPPIYPRTPLLSATFVWGHPSIPTLSAVYYHSTTHISLHPLIVLRFPSPSLIYPPSVTHIPVRQPGGQEECFPYTCHFYSGHPPNIT